MDNATTRQAGGGRWLKRGLITVGLLAGVWFAGNAAINRLVLRGGGVRIEPGVAAPAAETAHAHFWEALGYLDLPGARVLAGSPDQSDLAAAFELILAANLEGASAALQGLRARAADPRVAEAAADALAQLLLFDQRWDALVALAGDDPAILNRGSLDAGDLIFAQAFLDQPPQEIRFPAEPVRLAAGRTRFGQPMLRVRLNDCRRNFVVDTGAGFSVVASDVAEACGVLPLGDGVGQAATSTSNNVAFRPALARSLGVGEIEVANHPVAILEAADLEFALGPIPLLKIDGILGWPLFRDIAFDIDYEGGQTVLTPSGPGGDGPRNLFWLGYPVARLASAEGLPLHFGVDTGAVTTSIRDTLLGRIATGAVGTRRGISMGAGGGESVDRRFIRDVTFHLDGHALRFDRLSTSDGVKNAVGWQPDGRLGSDVARGGRLILDYRRGRMELVR